MLGQLNFLATTTRPDLATAVSNAAQVSSSPRPLHMKELLRIPQYLKTTNAYCPQRPELRNKLVAFVDASFADADKRRSRTGFVIYLNGCPISWRSTVQKSTALSSTEAEIIAACQAVREILWLRALLDDLGYTQDSPTIVFEDNTSAQSWWEEGIPTERNRHIATKYWRTREHVDAKDVTLCPISTDDQRADMFTKNLGVQSFRKHVGKMLTRPLEPAIFEITREAFITKETRHTVQAFSKPKYHKHDMEGRTYASIKKLSAHLGLKHE